MMQDVKGGPHGGLVQGQWERSERYEPQDVGDNALVAGWQRMLEGLHLRV